MLGVSSSFWLETKYSLSSFDQNCSFQKFLDMPVSPASFPELLRTPLSLGQPHCSSPKTPIKSFFLFSTFVLYYNYFFICISFGHLKLPIYRKDMTKSMIHSPTTHPHPSFICKHNSYRVRIIISERQFWRLLYSSMARMADWSHLLPHADQSAWRADLRRS